MKRFEERLELLEKRREKDEETHKKEISSQNAHIRQLTSDIKGLMNEVETLQYFRSDVVRIRQTILDAESHPKINTPKEARNTRNALAHGGNLLADVEAIKKMEVADPKRSENFRQLVRLELRYRRYRESPW
ncbi:hypothetical protein V8E54_004376 [Elaphomyces granulatus]|jgi:hypothetical protein